MTGSISAREGNFHPWWKSYRIEVVGLQSTSSTFESPAAHGKLEKSSLGYAATVNDTGRAQTIMLR